MIATINLSYPFYGHWQVRNSPANRVPSHGTTQFATAHAIDFGPVNEDGKSAIYTLNTFFRPEPPEKFVGSGREIHSRINGTVMAVHDGEPDHTAYRGLLSIHYAFTQNSRIGDGWKGLAGNHVLIGTVGVVIALCHLRQGSITVSLHQAVVVGQVVAECGNSGNSTEQHLHIQAMDSPEPEAVAAIPMTFRGELPRNGAIVTASRASS